MKTAVAAGEASARHLACLTDRVLVAAGEPQLYGTQYTHEPDGSDPRPQPVADPEFRCAPPPRLRVTQVSVPSARRAATWNATSRGFLASNPAMNCRSCSARRPVTAADAALY
ncbi:hypothetical protein [Streptomyces durmitorensis]